MREVIRELHAADLIRRKNEDALAAVASKRAEHAAGVRRQKAFLASIGVADVSPDDLATRPSRPETRRELSPEQPSDDERCGGKLGQKTCKNGMGV